MTEMEEFWTLLGKLGIDAQVYIDKQYIHTQALEANATRALSIGGVLDFCFDNQGKCVGINTDGIKSFVRRKK